MAWCIFQRKKILILHLKYKVNNLTPFRKEVIDIVNTVEYGKLLTYNDIFKTIAKNRSIEKSQVKQLGEQSV